MPKRRRDDRLAKLIDDTIGQLVTAVRAEVRRSVAEELSDYLRGGNTGGAPAVARVGRRGASNNGARKKVTQCIAPNCKNPSKGPRFHYLCETHKDAKKSEYEAWRKAAKDKASA